MREALSNEGGIVPQRIGEVVESASHQFTAQCYRLYQSPPLGAFVRTVSTLNPSVSPLSKGGLRGVERGVEGDGEPSSIYAVVYGVSTQALDPGRPVIARGEDEDSEEGIYRSNPQLARLLCTRFEALIVGHGDSNAYKQYLPALPPRIHAFVYPCAPEEVGQFTSEKLDFLTLLVNSSVAGRGITDEVIAACLRQASAQLENSRSFLVQAGKVLAVQLTGDLPRLNAILRRLSP